MKIASWNCNNLNSGVRNKAEIRKNRIDYLNLLRKKIQDLDVIFLAEVESDFPETSLDRDFSFHFFLPCVELDPGWQLTSGIFLAAAKHIRVLKHEVLLPGKETESAYGLALRTVLKDSRNHAELDMVSFWNLKRTHAKPAPDYQQILDLLMRKLTDAGFFTSGIPHLVIGDFNRSQDDIRKQIPDTETVLVSDPTLFPNKDPYSTHRSSPDHIICSREGKIKFLAADGNTADTFEQSLGVSAKSDFVRTGISDHLPLFVQI